MFSSFSSVVLNQLKIIIVSTRINAVKTNEYHHEPTWEKKNNINSSKRKRLALPYTYKIPTICQTYIAFSFCKQTIIYWWWIGGRCDHTPALKFRWLFSFECIGFGQTVEARTSALTHTHIHTANVSVPIWTGNVSPESHVYAYFGVWLSLMYHYKQLIFVVFRSVSCL